jgi:hypothetical protein
LDGYFDSGLSSDRYLRVVARISVGDFDHPEVRPYSGADISPFTDDSTTFRLYCARTGAVDCRVMGVNGLSGPRLDPLAKFAVPDATFASAFYHKPPIDPAILDLFEFFEWLDRASIDELLAFSERKEH